MGYQQALDKAWADVSALTSERSLTVDFMSDAYDIDIARRAVLSRSCNVPAKDHTIIILLHYLATKLTFKAIPEPAGEWIDFTRLEGGDAYWPTYKKRTIDQVLRKFGPAPEALLTVCERMPAKRSDFGDTSIIVYPFKEIGILIKVSKADEEFGPDAAILYDGNIPKIFCTEDIVVLTEIVVHQL